MFKPYQQIPILESGEPVVAIPLERFAVEVPHPYQKLAAPYGDRSPYYLRQTVLNSLLEAQDRLQVVHPDWRIKIFDAYRPIEVQKFMVDRSFAEVLKTQQLNLSELSEAQLEEVWQQVYQFWALPSLDPATPPPHATGAAVDITLVDEHGKTVDMGSAIDEVSPISYPDYFANSINPTEKQYHQHRQLLWNVMREAGFQRHPNEWWHFSLGDQLWAWLCDRENSPSQSIAKYGRI